MDKLFNSVACYTDIHLGAKHNSREHNDDCEEFLIWFIEQAKQRNCETCVFLGDFHHQRSSINVSTLNYTMRALELLSEAFDNVYMITGNHDLFYREKRDVHSLVVGKQFNNIHLIDTPFVSGDVAIVPWLVEDEWKSVKKIKTKYMFGHFEIPGFRMNAQISMPDHGQINKRHFTHQEYVFSGHFHCRQSEDNVHYIGNPFGHNYADAWDFNRGAMFLEWGGEPEYVDWENGPRYITCTMSELMENIEDYLCDKINIRVTLDTDVSYEDSQFIRELIEDSYDVRELKFIHSYSNEEEHKFDGEIEFQTVDQIVIEQLSNIESNTFDANMLVKLYNGL